MDQCIHPAITIGGGDGNGLGIARNLGQQGIDVYGTSSHRFEAMRYSKYCHKFFLIPGIEHNAQVLQRFLQTLKSRLPGCAVLFPTSDPAVLTLARIRGELSDAYATFIPSYDVVETLVKKDLFYRSLEQWGVPYPLTLSSREHDVATLIRRHTFPVYVRPSQSVPFVTAFGRKGFVASTPRALGHYLQLAAKHGLEVMTQDIIPGPTQNGFVFKGYFDRSSKLVTIFTTQKVRKPSMFTNTSITASVPLDSTSGLAAFQQVFIDYMTNMRYSGLFGAELKQDARDGSFKLLEINARSMGGSYMGRACDANDVLAAYRDALGWDVNPIFAYRSGVYLIHVLSDLRILLNRLLNRRLTKADLVPYLRQNTLNIFSQQDAAPFIMYLLTFLHWERHKLRVKAQASHHV